MSNQDSSPAQPQRPAPPPPARSRRLAPLARPAPNSRDARAVRVYRAYAALFPSISTLRRSRSRASAEYSTTSHQRSRRRPRTTSINPVRKRIINSITVGSTSLALPPLGPALPIQPLDLVRHADAITTRSLLQSASSPSPTPDVVFHSPSSPLLPAEPCGCVSVLLHGPPRPI